MGKDKVAKLATRRMRLKAKGKRQKAKSIRYAFVPLCLILFFTLQLFAQTPTEFLLLAEKLENGTTEEKREILFQMRNLESETGSRLAIPALKEVDEIVRATATHSVIYLPANEAVQILTPLLQDKSIFVRSEATYALGEVGNPDALSALLQTLQSDKELQVRDAAAVALGKIGDVSAVDELIKILQRKPKDKEEFLRRSAARSIGQIAEFVQTLEIQQTTPKSFLPRKYRDIPKPRYENLIATFPVFRSAINTLTNSLKNSKEFSDVKREAAFALGAIGDESANSILQANLNAEDYYLAEIAERSLWKIAVYKEYRDSEK